MLDNDIRQVLTSSAVHAQERLDALQAQLARLKGEKEEAEQQAHMHAQTAQAQVRQTYKMLTCKPSSESAC